MNTTDRHQRGLFYSATHQESGGSPATFATWEWTLAGRLDYRTTGAGTLSDYTYDAAGQLSSVNHSRSGTPLDAAAYGYDNRGRRTYLQRQGGRGDVFAYDTASQIDTAHYDANNPTAGTTGYTASDDYAFDAMGNRQSVARSPGGTTNYSTNTLNQYTTVAGLTHTHNANGAMTSDGSSDFVWDSEDRLVGTVPTGTINGRKSVAYVYGAFHRRLGKAVIGSGGLEKAVRYCYERWNPVLEIESNGSGALVESRPLVWGPDVSRSLQGAGGIGGLIAQQSAGTWSYYYCDGNGNVTSVVSSAVTATYHYDAFGNLLASSGGSAASNKYRFSTKPVDDECVVGGLAYYGYRYYHFALGRWPSRDPIGEKGGIKLLVMSSNSCLNKIDVFGLAEEFSCYNEGGVITAGNPYGIIVYKGGTEERWKGGKDDKVAQQILKKATEATKQANGLKIWMDFIQQGSLISTAEAVVTLQYRCCVCKEVDPDTGKRKLERTDVRTLSEPVKHRTTAEGQTTGANGGDIFKVTEKEDAEDFGIGIQDAKDELRDRAEADCKNLSGM